MKNNVWEGVATLPLPKKQPRDNVQCRYVFCITDTRCAPCAGKKLDCEKYDNGRQGKSPACQKGAAVT